SSSYSVSVYTVLYSLSLHDALPIYVFHYRWAARRCLRLLDLNSQLECVVVEGSRENDQAGEYVIDVAEYSQITGQPSSVDYFQLDRKSTRLNSSHQIISYAVFCLKK